MIPLSPRLLTCAGMVQGRTVCDIGTDHAYLPVWLITNGRADRVIATDVREGPLRAAKETLKRFGVSDRIALCLSDGFERIDPAGLTDAVIAGMGGETIRDILAAPAAAFLQNGVNLILQPMTKAEVLRIWLAENGFSVTKETAVKDSRVYTVMQAHCTGERHPLSAAESYIGKLQRSDPLTALYASGVLERLGSKAAGLAASGSTKEAAEIRRLIAEIQNLLNINAEKEEPESL